MQNQKFPEPSYITPRDKAFSFSNPAAPINQPVNSTIPLPPRMTDQTPGKGGDPTKK